MKFDFLFNVIVIMEILSCSEIDICVPSFPEIQHMFSISPFAVEFILGINLISHCIGALIVGNLGDKYGRKPIILSGLALFIFGSILCILSTNYYSILVGRFVQGFGISGPAVLAYVIIPDTYDIKTHQKLLGLLNFFTTAAMAAAPVVGSFVSLHYGWRGNFYLLLFLGIVCFFLGWVFLPEGKRDKNALLNLSEYKKIFKNKKAMYYVFTICFFVIGYWVFIAMAPILYMNDLGVKLENFGFYQGTLATIFAIVSLLNEKLFTYFGTRKCFFAGIGLVAMSLLFMFILMLTNSKNPLLITMALAVMSAGIICPVNILCPYAFEAAPNEKGKLGALLVFIKWVSISFFVQCASYFYNGSFFPIGIIIFAITVCALVLCRKLFKIENIFAKT